MVIPPFGKTRPEREGNDRKHKYCKERRHSDTDTEEGEVLARMQIEIKPRYFSYLRCFVSLCQIHSRTLISVLEMLCMTR